jgi:hypothetical protein
MRVWEIGTYSYTRLTFRKVAYTRLCNLARRIGGLCRNVGLWVVVSTFSTAKEK